MCNGYSRDSYFCAYRDTNIVYRLWLMPLASQYLLLVLGNVQAYFKMLFRVTC